MVQLDSHPTLGRTLVSAFLVEALAVLFVLIVAWLLLGALAAAVMRHRGHDTFSWAVLFLFLGPLAIPLAAVSDRQPRPEPPHDPCDGVLDVLVCHDGTPEADAALDAALALVGDSATSLTVAAVVDFEAATTVRGRDTQRAAQDRLDAIADRVRRQLTVPVDTVVLFGEPSGALQHFAAEHDYELIVVGSPPSGRTRRSPAARSVPVLVGPVSA